MDNTTTVQYAGLISQLSDKARSVVRDLDPSNDLTFLRIRSKKHEIMVAPGIKACFKIYTFKYQHFLIRRKQSPDNIL